jgi:hypothetical protein
MRLRKGLASMISALWFNRFASYFRPAAHVDELFAHWRTLAPFLHAGYKEKSKPEGSVQAAA